MHVKHNLFDFTDNDPQVLTILWKKTLPCILEISTFHQHPKILDGFCRNYFVNKNRLINRNHGNGSDKRKEKGMLEVNQRYDVAHESEKDETICVYN